MGKKRKVLWVTAIVGLPSILYLLNWWIGYHPHDARRSASLSHLKQINIATQMYQEENDGRFPPSMGTAEGLREALEEYTRSGRQVGPSTSIFDTLNPNGSGFLGNDRLATVRADRVAHPSMTISLFDSKNWDAKVSRNAGFVDGHVARVADQYLEWGLKVELDYSSR